jgi:hypothetical protein
MALSEKGWRCALWPWDIYKILGTSIFDRLRCSLAGSTA